MSSRTWIYVIILIIVLAAGGVFFWWMYKTSKITPKAEVTPTPTPETFTDVASDYWAFKEIEAVSEAGYMIGFDDGTFRPDDFADRATVAVGVAQADVGSAAVVPDGPATPSFTDVPTDHWAYKEIEYVNSQEFMTGYDETFRPEEFAVRYTIAIALARAKGLDLNNPPSEATFADVPTDAIYFAEVEAIYKAGYTQGCSTDPLKFCPTENLSRAALAVFLYNAYLRPAIVSPELPSPVPSTPVPSPSGISPTPTATLTATPTPTTTPTTITGTGTTTTSATAKTGPEIPLIAGGLLGALLLGRYLINRKIGK